MRRRLLSLFKQMGNCIIRLEWCLVLSRRDETLLDCDTLKLDGIQYLVHEVVLKREFQNSSSLLPDSIRTSKKHKVFSQIKVSRSLQGEGTWNSSSISAVSLNSKRASEVSFVSIFASKSQSNPPGYHSQWYSKFKSNNQFPGNVNTVFTLPSLFGLFAARLFGVLSFLLRIDITFQ